MFSPVPTPRLNRPPLSRSRVAAAWATTPGWNRHRGWSRRLRTRVPRWPAPSPRSWRRRTRPPTVVDPRMEVLGDDDHVESGSLGEHGVAYEFFGLPLFVAAEVGELRHRCLLEVVRDHRPAGSDRNPEAIPFAADGRHRARCVPEGPTARAPRRGLRPSHDRRTGRTAGYPDLPATIRPGSPTGSPTVSGGGLPGYLSHVRSHDRRPADG
jgi:hypothetical protein